MANEKIKYFSMFTGVGGFELGIGERAECVGFSEIDKYANQLLATKYPNIKNYGDATKINPGELPDFDMLCGGFPCQSFSIAGKRRGFEDTRGTMFFEVARILKIKRPKLVLLENVKGLLNHNKGETFSVILQTLEELGYRTQWMVLNSKFFGVPQNRERVFIIGSLRGESRPEILPFRGNCKEVSGKIKGTLESDGWEKRHEQIRRVWDIEGTAPTIPTAQGGGVMTKIAIPVLTPDRAEKRQNGRRFKEDGDESFTLTKTDIHGVMIQSHSPRTNDPSLGGSGPLISDKHCFTIDRTPHKVIMDLYNNKEHLDRTPALTEPHHNTLRVREDFKIRKLTPTECERLQGFPDNYTEGFSDTQRYKMMGNAVTVNVIQAIASKLFSSQKE